MWGGRVLWGCKAEVQKQGGLSLGTGSYHVHPVTSHASWWSAVSESEVRETKLNCRLLGLHKNRNWRILVVYIVRKPTSSYIPQGAFSVIIHLCRRGQALWLWVTYKDKAWLSSSLLWELGQVTVFSSQYWKLEVKIEPVAFGCRIEWYDLCEILDQVSYYQAGSAGQ